MLPFISSRLPLTLSGFSSAKRSGPTFSSLDRYTAYRRPSASEKEESHVEVNREKALEALEKLDQQLESLARKEVVHKKRPISSYPEIDRNSDMRMSMREELPELSGSFLAYSAGFLIILTIVNNLIFNFYVKPSVDGPDQPASTSQKIALTQRTE